MIMIPRRIEVRYIRQRTKWKAVLLSGDQRLSVYGPRPFDAIESICRLLKMPAERWRPISTAEERVLYEEHIPTSNRARSSI
jgi:hypothetical protein